MGRLCAPQATDLIRKGLGTPTWVHPLGYAAGHPPTPCQPNTRTTSPAPLPHLRQCSSGLQAIADVAAAIKAGFYTVGLAGGVETMSSNPMAWEGGINPRIGDFPAAQGCMLPMGVTSENVAAKYGIDRRTQVRRDDGAWDGKWKERGDGVA